MFKQILILCAALVSLNAGAWNATSTITVNNLGTTTLRLSVITTIWTGTTFNLLGQAVDVPPGVSTINSDVPWPSNTTPDGAWASVIDPATGQVVNFPVVSTWPAGTQTGHVVGSVSIGHVIPVVDTNAPTGGTNGIGGVLEVTQTDVYGSTYFEAGLALGFFMGGLGWIFRLVRQAAHQNPEM